MSELPNPQDSHPEPPTSTEPSIGPSIVPSPASPPPIVTPAATSPTTIAHTRSAPETEALLEIIRRGLAPDADPTARANALDVCGRIAQAFGPSVPAPPANLAPVAPVHAMPAPFAMPQGLAPSAPASPLAAAVGMLRNLPPEQVFDLAIQRLRAALPQGTPVPEPKGIQFQLVPVSPAGSKP